MPPAALIAGSVAAPIVGGLIGNSLASGDQEAAQKAMQQAAAIIGAVQIPDPSTLQIVLQKLQSQGQLTPELENALTQQASQLNSWTPDQNQEAAQNSALSSLQQQGKTGLSATDQSALNQINNQVAQQVQAQSQGALQNAAQRGMASSGNVLAAQLMAGQQGAQEAQQQGLSVAGQAQQNALNAIAQSGQLGSQMEQANFGRAAQQAQAQNAINQFNTANSQNVQNQNVAYQNQAQQANLANKQNLANQNVGLTNQQTQYNAQIPLQEYNMAMQKAQAQAGALTGLSNMYNNQAQATRSTFGGIGAGAGQGLGTAAAYSAMSPNSGTQNTFGTYQPTSAMGLPNAGPQQQYAKGGMVKGKEIVKGNSPKNDIIPAELSAGEFVMNKEEVKKAKTTKDPAKFMAEILHHMATSGKVKR